jgi:hypothetical protein
MEPGNRSRRRSAGISILKPLFSVKNAEPLSGVWAVLGTIVYVWNAMKMKCLECEKEAKWMKSTQFSGDFPYCAKHARAEEDFMKSDSYSFWYRIKQDREIKSKLGYSRIGLNNV